MSQVTKDREAQRRRVQHRTCTTKLVLLFIMQSYSISQATAGPLARKLASTRSSGATVKKRGDSATICTQRVCH